MKVHCSNSCFLGIFSKTVLCKYPFKTLPVIVSKGWDDEYEDDDVDDDGDDGDGDGDGDGGIDVGVLQFPFMKFFLSQDL